MFTVNVTNYDNFSSLLSFLFFSHIIPWSLCVQAGKSNVCDIPFSSSSFFVQINFDIFFLSSYVFLFICCEEVERKDFFFRFDVDEEIFIFFDDDDLVRLMDFKFKRGLFIS